jgi:hypothetical protein
MSLAAELLDFIEVSRVGLVDSLGPGKELELWQAPVTYDQTGERQERAKATELQPRSPSRSARWCSLVLGLFRHRCVFLESWINQILSLMDLETRQGRLKPLSPILRDQ